jgi:hypothetical protein
MSSIRVQQHSDAVCEDPCVATAQHPARWVAFTLRQNICGDHLDTRTIALRRDIADLASVVCFVSSLPQLCAMALSGPSPGEDVPTLVKSTRGVVDCLLSRLAMVQRERQDWPVFRLRKAELKLQKEAVLAAAVATAAARQTRQPYQDKDKSPAAHILK